jgi:uncharacterized protein (DUF849 family)
VLQACPNGSRLPGAHPALPVTPAEIADACARAVAAGAVDLHVHPKDDTGHDTVSPAVVDAVVRAVREAVPGVPIGVTSGAWSRGGDRLAAVAEWTALPDHVSVNFHEEGAEELAAALLKRGIGVDAGLFTGTNGADRLLAAGLGGDCRYLLVEVTDQTQAGPQLASGLLARLDVIDRPVLLHGEESATWPVLIEAVRRGLATRIGLEDVLVHRDGSPALDTADLVRSAIALGAQP